MAFTAKALFQVARSSFTSGALGANLVIGDVNDCGATVGLVADAGGKAVAVTLDVTDPAAAQAMVDAGLAAFGRLDGLVNNAALYGALKGGRFESIPESEWDACGLTAVPSELVAPPRVGESPVQMECRLKQVIEMGDQPGSGSLIIGEVLRMHVRDDLMENGRIVTERWNPIGRMAGATYVRCRDTFELERPKAPVRNG